MSANSNRRERLRQATAESHQALDHRVAGLDLTRSDHYRLLLEANAAALIPAELTVEQGGVMDVLPDWPRRSRRALIRADLEQLGAALEPLSWDRPAPSIPELFGILYVLEGSRLGARMMLPRVQASRDERVRAATRFLGATEPALWREFLHRLEAADFDDNDDALVRGALGTFALFARAFERTLAKRA
jgi:heme oxygenase (biliverdin-IX-beta and delta-forming)